ncbi:protease inhibitor I9 family protein [Kytococcus sp. Marseille-QA3725]
MQPTPQQDENATYVVMLHQSPEVEEAGGLGTDAGKAVTRAHTERTVERMCAEGVEVRSVFQTIGGFSADLTPEQVARLEADPEVSSVGRNREVRAFGI